LATQAAEVLEALGGGDVLEFGAGTGALAAEMLTTLARLDALPARYLILEPSPDLAGRQRDSMARRVPELAPLVHWVTEPPADLPRTYHRQ
jgi:SAM-dependent MidA family methyltransferase